MSEGMSYFHGKQTQAGLEDLKEFENIVMLLPGSSGNS
jgi:farnesyl-diphosphate farnesyltransferase